MEVSSHALDLHRVGGTRFAVGVFTNLGVDHLDFHGDLQSYEAAKARLFTPELTDLGIVSTDTEAGERITNRRNPDHPRRHDRSRGRLEWSDRQSFPVAGHEVSLPLAGPFNVTNAALAAEAVAALGYDDDDVAVALGRVRGVPGRFETVHAGQAFTVVIDYAHTPDGLEAVLAAAREITERTLTSFSAPAATEIREAAPDGRGRPPPRRPGRRHERQPSR